MRAPAVSVLMPVRDGRYLREALTSILAQSLADLEVILVDDGMAAEHRRMADALGDGRLRIVRHDGAPGLAAVLNTGLSEVRAPLVARADADDRYRPDRLARQVPVFAARPRLVALSCGYHRIDDAGRRLHTHRPVSGPDVIRFRAMFSNSLLHPGAVFRSRAVRDAGGYDTAYWTAQDSDLWARLMADGGEVDNLPDPLVDWRAHDASVLSSRGAAGRRLSLSVSRRLQEGYLGAAQNDGDVAAAVDLWRSYSPLDPVDISRGHAQLQQILHAAIAREPPAVLRDFRRCMAAACLRQARFATRRPRLAAGLVSRTLRWRWGPPASPDDTARLAS